MNATGTTMCLTPDEARIVNKTFNAEEYYRMSDSLCELRFNNAKGIIESYEMVLGLDSLNAVDRMQQVINLKTAYDNSTGRETLLAGELAEMMKYGKKQSRRKKAWRGITFVALPVAFVGGFVVALRL